MEHQKIKNLDTTFDNVPGFIAKQWIEFHDQSGNSENRYKPNKQIEFKTSMLRSDLYDYSDAYIVATGNITVVNENNNDNYNRKLAFENNAPLTACIWKLNGILIDNAEDLDAVMPTCAICLNTVKIMKKQQDVCGSIIEMNQKMVQYVTEMRK